MTETVSQVGLGSADCTPLPRSSPLRRGLQNSREYCMRLKLLICITGSNMLACKRDNLSTMKQHDIASCKPWLCLELPVCVMSTSNARDAPWQKMLKKKNKKNNADKTENSHASRCAAPAWKMTLRALPLWDFCAQDTFMCLQKHPPTSEEHTLPPVGCAGR